MTQFMFNPVDYNFSSRPQKGKREMTNQITSIEIVFSRGSFEEWTEGSGDSYPQAFIGEWECNYNAVVTARLKTAFPNATIDVGEGYDQTGQTEINIQDDEGNWLDAEEWRGEIEHIIDIGSDGGALDGVWETPSVEAITQAIEDLTGEKPVARLEYGGADYVFARHDGAYHWLDLDLLDIEVVFNPETWESGTSEAAAIAFRQEFDDEFERGKAEKAKIARLIAPPS